MLVIVVCLPLRIRSVFIPEINVEGVMIDCQGVQHNVMLALGVNPTVYYCREMRPEIAHGLPWHVSRS